MRQLILSAALMLISLAVNTTLAKYGPRTPDWVIVALYLAPLAPLGWWVYTHEKLAQKRAWLRDRCTQKPTTTVYRNSYWTSYRHC